MLRLTRRRWGIVSGKGEGRYAINTRLGTSWQSIVSTVPAPAPALATVPAPATTTCPQHVPENRGCSICKVGQRVQHCGLSTFVADVLCLLVYSAFTFDSDASVSSLTGKSCVTWHAQRAEYTYMLITKTAARQHKLEVPGWHSRCHHVQKKACAASL